MSSLRWMTPAKAEELTGLPATWFEERTGPSGKWPEGKAWKWHDGRKLIDLDAFYDMVDAAPSVPSMRGRNLSRRTSGGPQCHAPSTPPASSLATRTSS